MEKSRMDEALDDAEETALRAWASCRAVWRALPADASENTRHMVEDAICLAEGLCEKVYALTLDQDREHMPGAGQPPVTGK